MQGIMLVRHGKADAPAGDRFRGREDFALSSEGCVQAERVARALKGKGIDLVVSSPLLRARQTAEAIALVLRADTEIDDDLIVGVGPRGFWRIRLDTASVSEIRLLPEPVLIRLNGVVM